MLNKKKICHFCNTEQFIWKNVDGKKACKPCSQKIKPTERLKPSRSPIPKFSDKRKKEQVAYSALRKVFLKDHPFCQLSIAGICTKVSTDIQHKRGRLEYFLDTTTWASSCRSCHSYANDHPQEAIENGWAELRLKNYENE